MFGSGSSSTTRKKAIVEPLLSTRAQNPWSQDDNKIGQKMLEKMGWKKGQGVGLHNQGIVQNIKLISNKGSKGLGFRVKQDELWTAASDNFSQLLSELSNGSEIELTSIPDQSLQLRSQRSRSRVFYKKFSRGKDISEYDMKDLSCVIGGLDEDISRRNFMNAPNDGVLINVNEVNSNSPANNSVLCREIEETIEEFKPKRKRKKTTLAVEKESTNVNEQLPEEIILPNTGMSERVEFKPKSKRKKLEKAEKVKSTNENEKSTEYENVNGIEMKENVSGIEMKESIKPKSKRKKLAKAVEKEYTSEKSFENEEIIMKLKSKNKRKKYKKSIEKELKEINENLPKKGKTKASINLKDKSETPLINEVKNLLTNTKDEGNVENMKKFIIEFEEEASQLMKKHNEELNKHETYRLNQVSKEIIEKRARNEKAAFRMKIVQEIKQNNFVPSFKGSNISVIEGYPTSKRYA